MVFQINIDLSNCKYSFLVGLARIVNEYEKLSELANFLASAKQDNKLGYTDGDCLADAKNAVIRNPIADEKIFLMFANDENYVVRMDVAECDKAPEAVLEHLSKDANPLVVSELIYNKNTTCNIIDKVADRVLNGDICLDFADEDYAMDVALFLGDLIEHPLISKEKAELLKKFWSEYFGDAFGDAI